MKTLPDTQTAAATGRLLPPAGLDEEERTVYARIPSKVGFVGNPEFAAASAEERFFGQNAPRIEVSAWTHFPEVAQDAVGGSAGRPRLASKDEAALFLRYNYARYRLKKLLALQARRNTASRAKEVITWFMRGQDIQGKLVRANMALVLAMAKRTRIPNVEFGELISEGNMALLRSIEKFDVTRGFKFSTYACRAILKSFSRLATSTGRYRQRFPVEFDPELERSDCDVQRHELQRDDSVEALRDILVRNRAKLTEVERTIVMERFGIGSTEKGRTLAEVGKVVGLTNERVRQIQNLALQKIREALEQEYLVA
jgi:RNA polymerase sigma factor (sigma-70 family)